MGRIARHVWIKGSVQGVGFRHHTGQVARALDVYGWVRNCPDGSVEVWAEGEASAVERMLAWLRRGPPAAKVDTVDVEDAVPQSDDSFRTRLD